MDGNPTISLSRFWNYVALPLFAFVMAFGVFVLFNVGGSQLMGTQTVLSTIARLKENPVAFREREVRARRNAPTVSAAKI